MYDIDDFLNRAQQELGAYGQQEQRFSQLVGENRKRRDELMDRLVAAQAQLAAVALGDMADGSAADSAIQAAAARLSLPELGQILAQTKARGAQIDARVGEIDADPRFIDRDLGRLRIEQQWRDEEPYRDAAAKQASELDSFPWMRDLIERGWGTERYPHRGFFRFFKREFLRDWKNADAAVEHFKETDFSALAARYAEKMQEARDMEAAASRLVAERQALEDMETERSSLMAEKDTLPQALRARTGAALFECLQVRGPSAADAFPDPEALKRTQASVDGISHQMRYLDGVNDQINTDLSQLNERAGKLRDEANRYSSNRHRYRNKSFTDDQFGKRFGRTSRYDRVYDRYNRTSQTIYVFHDYDRYYYGPTVSDMLWWDVMTDGRLDGNYIPEVAEWRSDHPGYAYDRGQYASDPSFADDPRDTNGFDLRDDS